MDPEKKLDYAKHAKPNCGLCHGRGYVTGKLWKLVKSPGKPRLDAHVKLPCNCVRKMPR